MRTFEEIKTYSRLKVKNIGKDGGMGMISFPMWTGSIVWSYGAGWEHVSVSPLTHKIMPSWDEMCIIKDIFWNDEEAVIQIHPPKSQYVNNMKNCLHLWRCSYKDMLLPPSCLVGIRPGQSQFEIQKEIKAAYELAGEHYE